MTGLDDLVPASSDRWEVAVPDAEWEAAIDALPPEVILALNFLRAVLDLWPGDLQSMVTPGTWPYWTAEGMPAIRSLYETWGRCYGVSGLVLPLGAARTIVRFYRSEPSEHDLHLTTRTGPPDPRLLGAAGLQMCLDDHGLWTVERFLPPGNLEGRS